MTPLPSADGQASGHRDISGNRGITPWERIEPLLASVERPSRYLGGEVGSVVRSQADIRIALSYPDLYEIGISNLGLSVLYDRLLRLEGVAPERVYLPDCDMQDLLRSQGVPLMTLETKTPVRECDILGITLQSELTLTNVLALLDLCGIPLLASERETDEPLVIGGGPCAYNPEPSADFFDAYFIGEAEEGIGEVVAQLTAWKAGGRFGGRRALLEALTAIDGVYVPSLHPGPLAAGDECISRRVLPELNSDVSAIRTFVPFTEAVHERAVVELFRGCARGCRFCQAGMVYRPVREREPADVIATANLALAESGYRELSLSSLCTSDYTAITELLTELPRERSLTLSLPSLRVDSFSVGLAGLAASNRRGGITLAPEAGSQRMRDVINKGVTEADIISAVSAAFEGGWTRIKLYFMIGLPGETEEDIVAIADLVDAIVTQGRRLLGKQAGRLKISVSASTLVPKSHTPFQWSAQLPSAEVRRRQDILRDRIKGRQVQLKWHDERMTTIEGVLARGDRSLSALLMAAYRKGCSFDAWSNRLNWDAWQEAIAETIGEEGVQRYLGAREVAAPLPWDHINSGVSKSFLLQESLRAQKAELTEDCRGGICEVCGICQSYPVSNVLSAEWGQA